MTEYYVVGVLQHTTSDEWLEVNRQVQTRYWEDAALEAGNQTLVDEGESDGPYTSVDDFGDWDYWLMAVVELIPGLPVRYNGSAANMQDLDELAAETTGAAAAPLWVAVLDLTSGEVWVQRARADGVEDIQDAARDAFGSSSLPGLYGYVVERTDGVFVVFGDKVTEIGGSADVAVALDAINRHRVRVGQRPLDPAAAGWGDRDILEEAARLGPAPNPERLKRRLLRWA